MPDQEVAREKDWWDKSVFYIDSGHWTSARIFASRERHWICNSVCKIRFYSHVIRLCRKAAFWKRARVLVAPIGDGSETKYLRGVASEIHGIDISPTALAKCPGDLILKQGDIRAMPYDNDFFDVVVCPLFLHHVHDVGFTPYVEEFHRVLKRGGVLAIQEPSALFPFAWVFGFLRTLMGNVTGQVPGERPLRPGKLTRTLRIAGFDNVHIRGLGYNHVRTPVMVQFFVNMLDGIARRTPLLRRLCYNVGFFARK